MNSKSIFNVFNKKQYLNVKCMSGKKKLKISGKCYMVTPQFASQACNQKQIA